MISYDVQKPTDHNLAFLGVKDGGKNSKVVIVLALPGIIIIITLVFKAWFLPFGQRQ